MADFEACYAFMEDNEDSQSLHKNVDDSFDLHKPDGTVVHIQARAISGVNSYYHPQQFAAIAALPQAERGPAVEAFYKEEFWNNWLGAITATPLAMRVFDAAVNMGHTAVHLLQEAVNAMQPSAPIADDGVWGTQTITAVNALDAAALLTQFQDLRYAHYFTHDAGNPALPGLLARARK